MEKIYFVSKNKKKYAEIKEILSDRFVVEAYAERIPELQVDKLDDLIKNKAMEAFKIVKRPVVVEHTVLMIDAFKGLPGLQTSYFYKHMGYENIFEYCDEHDNYKATVISAFCLCDGKKFLVGKGKEKGRIVNPGKKGLNRNVFDWDCIFAPKKKNSKNLTYAQMTTKGKNKRSMRRKAWKDLKKKNNTYLNYLCTNSIENDDNDKELKELARLIKQKRVMLFIGSGISASVDFPTWDGLIKDLGAIHGYEDGLFQCYGDNMMLAEYVKNKGFDQLSEQIKIKFQCTEEIKRRLAKSKIYENILEMEIPVIYTTNYDHLIEEYYELKKVPYKKVVNINDMEDISPDSTRIMKFHGDIDNENSIVLSESQYFKRMDFQSFMDVQLQADMLQYHILFLGYSLSDINIKLLMYLARMRHEGAKAMKAYIFTATPNQIQKEVFERNNIISFSGECCDKEKGTNQFLADLKKAVDECDEITSN